METRDRSTRTDTVEFVPWDIEVAYLNFGANCGPVSFAAITKRDVCRSMCHFSHFEHFQWTNLTQMRRAFTAAGYETVKLPRQLPNHGVALIQWLGPWTARNFFSRWSLIHTHWIAIQGNQVFDHTVGVWQTLSDWSHNTVPNFLSQIPRAYSWAVKYGVEVVRSNLPCQKSGSPTTGGVALSARSLAR